MHFLLFGLINPFRMASKRHRHWLPTGNSYKKKNLTKDDVFRLVFFVDNYIIWRGLMSTTKAGNTFIYLLFVDYWFWNTGYWCCGCSTRNSGHRWSCFLHTGNTVMWPIAYDNDCGLLWNLQWNFGCKCYCKYVCTSWF